MENIHITYKSSVVRTGDSVFWAETRFGICPTEVVCRTGEIFL